MKLFKKYLSIVLASLCLLINFAPKADADTGAVLKSVGKGLVVTGAAVGGAAVSVKAVLGLIYLLIKATEKIQSETVNRILGIPIGLLFGLSMIPFHAYIGGGLAGWATYKAMS